MENIPKLVFHPIASSDRAIAEICNGHLDNEIIYINERISSSDSQNKQPISKRIRVAKIQRHVDPEDIEMMRSFKITDEGTMMPVPKPDGPEHGYIFGSTGSGKSVFCSFYAKQYSQLFQDNPIYLVSNVDIDPALDPIKNLIRVPLDDVKDGKILPTTIGNSLIIFDDVDAIVNKELAVTVELVRDNLLTLGRHYGIYVVCTSHLGLGSAHSRVPLNESSFIVSFPHGGNWHHLSTVMTKYAGLSKNQVQVLHDLPTRWILVNKTYPSYVLYEKGVYLLCD